MVIRQSGIQQDAVTTNTPPQNTTPNNSNQHAKTTEPDPLDDIPFPGDPMLCDIDLTEALGIDIDVDALDLYWFFYRNIIKSLATYSAW